MKERYNIENHVSIECHQLEPYVITNSKLDYNPDSLSYINSKE